MNSRKSTGVIGLDEKTEGGFVDRSTVLLRGKAGTGKTAFCASFLYRGALNNEPGLLVTTEEEADDIRADIKEMFGWDLEHLEKKKLLKILSINLEIPYNVKEKDFGQTIHMYMLTLFEKIINSIKAIKAKRVVIDSVSILEMFLQNRYLSRTYILNLMKKLKSLGVTTLITEGISEEGGLLGDEALTEFVVDAVIKLDFVPVSDRFKRTLTINKMRRTKHSTMILPFDFTKEGIKLMKFGERK